MERRLEREEQRETGHDNTDRAKQQERRSQTEEQNTTSETGQQTVPQSNKTIIRYPRAINPN